MRKSYSKLRHMMNVNESLENNYYNKKLIYENTTGMTSTSTGGTMLMTGTTKTNYDTTSGGTKQKDAQVVENIIRKIVRENKDESMVQKLMRKLKGVSDKQLKYNVENDLPWDWKGSKEGYYEKMENKRHNSGSN
jgi:hypothetical protein